MAGGVLLISACYAAGRAGASYPAWDAGYWLGEAMLFGPVAWRLLSRPRLGEGEAAGLALGLATATYVVKFCYSPSAFTFPDELEHLRTTVSMLSTHHLFGVNYLLPVSPDYPGLEEATAALVSLTGMPVFAAGLLVAGLAHLLFAAALYVVFRVVSGSAVVAVAAVAVYATNPHYQIFDAIYGYQTLALAFFGLALVAALGIWAPGIWAPGIGGSPAGARRACWWALAVALAAATVVTHHVTSYVLAGSLLLLAAAAAARRAAPIRPAILAAACVALIAIWTAVAAGATLGYLTPPVRGLADGLAGVFGAHVAAGSTGTPSGPPADQFAAYAATVLVMAGLPFGWWRIWRTQRGNTWALALGIGAVGYYVLTALRLTTPDGSELAGRALTFVYIPVGYTLAMAVFGSGSLRWPRWLRWPRLAGRRAAPRVVLGAVAGAILLAGGIATGWPPYWERLPGRFVVDGFESGVTPEGIAAATWTLDTLGPGQRIAADFTNELLLGSYGDQDPVGSLPSLYCGPDWTITDTYLANQQQIRYLVVDLRMSEQPTLAGGYFSVSSSGCPSPIPRSYLTKFDSVSGFDRIYDSGNIIIYDISGA